MDLGTSLHLFTPELLLVVCLILLFLADSFIPSSRKNIVPLVVTVGFCVLAALVTHSLYGEEQSLYFSGLVANDQFALFFRFIFLFSCAASAYLAFGSKELKPKDRMEFTLLLVAITFGLSLMAIASNLLILYIGIETVSIISYVMAGFSKRDLKASEASFKYLIFGALSSGLMLYGLSLLYGYAGSLHYSEIARFLATQSEIPVSFWFIAVLIYTGFAYKISAFPMHWWTPDVYEGAPTPVAAFFSIGPKAAGFAAFIRFMVEVFAVQTPPAATAIGYSWREMVGFSWTPIVAIAAAITMTVGNLSAIGQTNVKRMLAYSSIAHVGYMLMGLVAQDGFGVSAILFYIVAYCGMNLGAFWVASIVHDLRGGTSLEDFKGLGWTTPLLGITMGIFLFSLTGIPMFSGFIGKFLLFGAVVKTPGYMWLGIFGVLNSVVSLFYYAKVLKAMWFEKPDEGEEFVVSLYHNVALVGLAIPTILLGLFFGPLVKFTELSVLFGNY